MTLHQSLWTALVDVAFEQRWVNINGLRTRYVHAGTCGQPAIVMIHGTAGSWEAFARNLGALSQHYDCYALDMVGSGFTDKPDTPYEIPVYTQHLLGFLDALQLPQAHLVGCSLGSWIAAHTARHHPNRVQSLGMLSAAGYFANAGNMSRIRTARTRAVDHPTWENIQPIFDHLIHDPANRLPDLVAVRQRVYQNPQMAKAMRHILCLQEPGTRERNLLTEADWRQISAPSLVVGSLADKDEYLETARLVAKLIPNARYCEMPGVGHWPQFEDANTFNKLYLEFLQAL